MNERQVEAYHEAKSINIELVRSIKTALKQNTLKQRDIHWGHVGDQGRYHAILKDLNDMLTHQGEYA